LKNEPDFEVVSSLETDETMFSKIQTDNVDIILLDLGLQSYDSLDVAKLIKNNNPNAHVVLMGLFATQSEILDYVKVGVKGFILKDATVSDFLSTIRSVSKGEVVLPAYLTESLFAQIIEKSLSDPLAKTKILDSVKMTQRELQVIERIAEGLSNKEIAQKLFVSPHTIKSHVHNILEKLTLHSRIQIATYALEKDD
jgi:DNA-binding NarL/FixJ family response regulator